MIDQKSETKTCPLCGTEMDYDEEELVYICPHKECANYGEELYEHHINSQNNQISKIREEAQLEAYNHKHEYNPNEDTDGLCTVCGQDYYESTQYLQKELLQCRIVKKQHVYAINAIQFKWVKDLREKSELQDEVENLRTYTKQQQALLPISVLLPKSKDCS